MQQLLFPQATSHGVSRSMMRVSLFVYYPTSRCWLAVCVCVVDGGRRSCLSLASVSHHGTFYETHGTQNILTFTPPGFKQTLSVKYPDSRLAVCHKCKKNFKTRDMCRVRNTHTDPPWTTAYVCITMDESCTDEKGNFVDKPLTLRMVQWQPYAVMKDFSKKTPVCSACKRTNRTKSFCRERHKHRHLPWCTVYVLLSALENADPSTVVAGASKPATEANNNVVESTPTVTPATEAVKATMKEGTPPTDSSHSTLSPSEGEKKAASPPDFTEIETEPPGLGDDIHDIAPSRTFLALVSSRGTSIHWLELLEYDEPLPNISQHPAAPVAAAAGASPPVESPYGMVSPPPMDHGAMLTHPQYYGAYTQQQHQSALKSHQQYYFQLQQQQQQQQQQSQQQPGSQQTPQRQPPQPLHPMQGYPPQWQQYSPMEMPTAGEAAAARRRGEELPHPPPAPMWPMYPYPPTHMYPMMPPGGSPGMMPPHIAPHPHHLHPAHHPGLPPHHIHHHHQQQQHPLHPHENGNGDAISEPYTPQATRTLPPQTEEDEEEEGAEAQEEEHGETNQDEEERDTKRLRTV